MKPVHRLLINIASVIIGLAGIAAALVYVNRSEPAPATAAPSAPAATPAAEISRDALAGYDGTNGNQCYVAVDGTVYLIEGRPLWANGQHAPSGGRAVCGKDLSTVIDQSPHGRSKLQLLTVVGRLS